MQSQSEVMLSRVILKVLKYVTAYWHVLAGKGRVSANNQHKYPRMGSEGTAAAAGTGLSAKGLINDSSVVRRWCLFTVIQLFTRPRASQK